MPHHKRRDHGRGAPKPVADAVCPKAYFGRKKFWRVDTEQQCRLDIDGDDQYRPYTKDRNRIRARVEASINPAERNGADRSNDNAPSSADRIGKICAQCTAHQQRDSKHNGIAKRVSDGQALPQKELGQEDYEAKNKRIDRDQTPTSDEQALQEA